VDKMFYGFVRKSDEVTNWNWIAWCMVYKLFGIFFAFIRRCFLNRPQNTFQPPQVPAYSNDLSSKHCHNSKTAVALLSYSLLASCVCRYFLMMWNSKNTLNFDKRISNDLVSKNFRWISFFNIIFCQEF
jgi:hypothetical protein